MFSNSKTCINKTDLQVSELEVGNSSSGRTFGQKSPLTRGILAEFNSPVLPTRTRVGLYCFEARELSSVPKCSQSSQICNEGQQLRDPPNRRKKLAKKQSNEERSILRVCSQVDAGRKKYRRIRRTVSRYGRKQLAEAAKVQEISGTEKKKNCGKRPREVENTEYHISRPGFSGAGDMDEQQPWYLHSPPLQDETTMAVGLFQPWEDFLDYETEEVLSDLYGSDGLEELG